MLTIKFELKTKGDAESFTYQLCKSLAGWDEFVNDEAFIPDPYQDEKGSWIIELTLYSNKEAAYEMEVKALPTFIKTEDIVKHCGSWTLR